MDPWQSVGGVQATLVEKRVVVQDRGNNDLVRIGRGDDGEVVVQMLDLGGQERVRIGQLGDEYGIRVRNQNGTIVYEVDNTGQSLPFVHVPMGLNGGIAGLGIDDATYAADGQYLSDFYVVAPRLKLTWGTSFLTGSTATCDVRTRFIVGGVSHTLGETIGITSPTNTTIDVLLPVGSIGNTCRILVEARRTSGTDLVGLQMVLHPINYA